MKKEKDQSVQKKENDREKAEEKKKSNPCTVGRRAAAPCFSLYDEKRIWPCGYFPITKKAKPHQQKIEKGE